MTSTNATTGTEAMTATPTTRHETLAAAFAASILTAGRGIIHRYHGEFYVVAFESMEWAESCGMRVATDFSDLGIPKPYHASPDYA